MPKKTDKPLDYTAQVYTDLSQLSSEQWNALIPAQNPFVEHGFLHAMSQTGSAGKAQGWQAAHLVLEHNQQILAAAPGWQKSNSHGEFVFDWSWADFFHRYQQSYYPKYLCASPFSPIPGPRILAQDEATALALIQEQIKLTRSGFSSAHWNFIHEQDAKWIDQALPDVISRVQWQFHWHNQNYVSFDDFLATLSRKKRKNIRQERKSVQNAQVTFRRVRSNEATEEDWTFAYQMYCQTFYEKGNHPAIAKAFFQQSHVPFLLVIAEKNAQAIACAIFIESPTTLYGRYWGSIEKISGLHFETCYYQGIEYCIENNIQCLEPGAQGEHKIARGFLPVPAWSRHWIADARFAEPIREHCLMETEAMLAYGEELKAQNPYQNGTRLNP